MRRLFPILAVAAALPLAVPAAHAKGLNGCPDGQFTLDTCVMCLPGYAHHKTGSTGDGGKDCYECAKVTRATQETPRCAEPVLLPADGVIEPGIFGPAEGH